MIFGISITTYDNLRLPENWVRFNSFGKRVPREILLEHGLDPQVHHRLAFQALGMGDTNACCIAQSVHEHILQQGELLKSKRKLQYGRAVPQTSMWQGICLDDLLITKICDHDREVKPGFIPPDDGVAQKKAHDVYEKVGLTRAEHKSFAACTEFRASGAHVDGIVGTAGAPANCRQDLWRLIQKVLNISCITKRVFQRLFVEATCGYVAPPAEPSVARKPGSKCMFRGYGCIRKVFILEGYLKLGSSQPR